MDRMTRAYMRLFPDQPIPSPASKPVLHNSLISKRDELIVNAVDPELQSELNDIITVSLSPPAPTTGAELTVELIKRLIASTNFDQAAHSLYTGKNFTTNYVSYLQQDLSLNLTDSQLGGLFRTWDRVTNWIIYAKYTHLRPRPIELAATHDLILEPVEPFIEESWSRTPSFPSLRFGLAYSAANYLSHSHPKYYGVLKKKAGNIGGYLIHGNLNFRSDLTAIFSLLQDNIISADDLRVRENQYEQKRRRAERKVSEATIRKHQHDRNRKKKRLQTPTHPSSPSLKTPVI